MGTLHFASKPKVLKIFPPFFRCLVECLPIGQLHNSQRLNNCTNYNYMWPRESCRKFSLNRSRSGWCAPSKGAYIGGMVCTI